MPHGGLADVEPSIEPRLLFYATNAVPREHAARDVPVGHSGKQGAATAGLASRLRECAWHPLLVAPSLNHHRRRSFADMHSHAALQSAASE
jgi:hypothetical protein